MTGSDSANPGGTTRTHASAAPRDGNHRFSPR